MNKIIFAIVFVLDTLTIPCACLVAYAIKFPTQTLTEPYAILSVIATIVWMMSFLFYGVYRQYVGPLYIIDTIIAVTKGSFIACIQLMALSFLIPQLPESRAVIAYAFGLCVAITSSVRIVLWKFEQWRWFRLSQHKKAIIIGGGDAEQMVIETLLHQPSYCIHYIGSIANEPPTQFRYKINTYYRHLGPESDLDTILDAHNPDIIYVTDPDFQFPSNTVINRYKNKLHIVANTQLFQHIPIQTQSLDSLSFLHAQCIGYAPIERRIKAVLDRGIALIALIVLAPLMICIGLGIYVSSPGSIFFTQERLTKSMQPFTMIKFRTMVLNAEQATGPICVVGNDPRIFPLGRLLRRLSLDELPQLFNILAGDMSFVGPRPERPHFVNLYTQETPHFTQRYRVKAGLTGWAQVNGRSYLTPHPALKLYYDLYYIYNWSLLLDLKIILKTLLVVLKREAVH